jgi:hypothetical protein
MAEQSPTENRQNKRVGSSGTVSGALRGLLEFFDHPIREDLEPPFLLT